MEKRELVERLKNVERSGDALSPLGGAFYYPCSTELNDGRTLECVYFGDKKDYVKHWGNTTSGRFFVDLSEVKAISECKYCISSKLAKKIYDSGESGMGYYKFRIVMKDGKIFPYLTGDAVEYLELPEGYTIEDIVDVKPFYQSPREGKCMDYTDYWKKGYYGSKRYYWCLIEDLDEELKQP